MPTLHWIGKDKVINHHREVPYKVLQHQYGFTAGEGEDERPTGSGNMVIHGDNLEALKSLLPQYEGKVKCIYIDPPYNTGEEKWRYNDNVNDPRLLRWLEDAVGKEGEDLSRHDKWLCMMYPRLVLLHKLLSPDGAIFVSIDDNELGNLQLILNEIFGTANHIANFIWEKRTNRENRKEVSYRHDYVVAYRKDSIAVGSKMKLLQMSADALARYKNPDLDPRGPWKSDPATAQAGHATASQFYVLEAPNGKRNELPSGGCWVYTEHVMNSEIADGKIWFGVDGNGVPRIKTYLHAKERGLVPETLWFASEVSTNEGAKNELKEIFDGKAVFETPKPFELVQRVLEIASGKDSIVLDSFAGSGTTAHAVLNLNKQDGGDRKFILVEMMDYTDSITAERVKRVMNGYGEGRKSIEGTGGAFDYYTLGEPLFNENQDLNEAVGTERIREYIWYTETRSPLFHSTNDQPPQTKDQRPATKDNSPYLLGTHEGMALYFVYEPDRLTTLDHDLLATLPVKGTPTIIYADNCLLPKKFMEQHGIIFKKIPRDISRF
ncbi:MAG: site-specific DNA-methyltransferase [Flavobacteriales bacterium]|nr:site-specific DNA-methyltransferase [Flavobacteriales bacterium]